jgi:hypothetical protein
MAANASAIVAIAMNPIAIVDRVSSAMTALVIGNSFPIFGSNRIYMSPAYRPGTLRI